VELRAVLDPLALHPLATLTITISQHTRIDGVPSNARVIGEASSCELIGDQVRASQAGGSSDWLTLHADGSVSVDARLLLATPTGHHLTITYRGRAAALPVTGAPVFVTPTFETDDPELQWLNRVQAVGKGRRDGTTLTYDLYELS
jgi:cyanophycinase-like exopeptidase